MNSNEIIFQHLVELSNCDCIFCSTLDESTGRKALFLVFNEKRRIYIRNARKDTWDELTDENQYNRVRDGFNTAILEKRIPVFRSEALV